MVRSWQRYTAPAMLAILVVASVAFAAATFRTSLHYLFRNGITIEQGDAASADAAFVAPLMVGASDLAASSVTAAKVVGGFLTVGASPAATCTQGDMHIDTDETVDTNCTTTADNSLCVCHATNTWASTE